MFRGWNTVEKRFLTTKELLRVINSEVSRQFILNNNYISLTGKPDPSDEVIFQQFTGLKDVDGVDVYEGDIIEFIPDILNFLNDDCIHNNWGHVWFSSLELGATVSFNHPYSEYSMSWAEILKAFYSSDFRKETKCEFLDFKVVGNIFEDKNDIR